MQKIEISEHIVIDPEICHGQKPQSKNTSAC
jgi:uncharacterized protein (DUF433 family)